jgi:hypothetical protein
MSEKFELNENTLPEFKTRFRTFHDAVIHRMVLDLFKQDKIVLIIGTHDWSLSNDYTKNWINISIVLENLTWFVVKQLQHHRLGIIFRLNIDSYDSKIHVDLLGNTDKPSQDIYEENLESNECGFAMVANTAFYSISKYTTTVDSNMDIEQL